MPPVADADPSRGGDHGAPHTSLASHAHPRPLWHVFARLMHVLPHAWPFSQTLQHCEAGMQLASANDGPAIETKHVATRTSVSAKRAMIHRRPIEDEIVVRAAPRPSCEGRGRCSVGGDDRKGGS